MIKLYPDFDEYEYINGEILIDYKNAVLPIDCASYGIKPLPTKRNDGVEFGEQGVVGRLFLTNYRLFFKAVNKFARMIDGKLSIFLPSIIEVQNTSFLTSREILIKTKTNESNFKLLGIGGWQPGFNREKQFIRKIEESRLSFHESFIDEIAQHVTNESDSVYTSFKINKKINSFFNILTPFLHPEINQGNIVDATLHIKTDDVKKINKECIGYKMINEFRKEIIKTTQNKV